MRKTLLCLFALLLTATAASAQENTQLKSSPKALGRQPAKIVSPTRSGSQPATRAELGEGERIMGFYNSDELDLSGGCNMGFNIAPGTVKVAAGFAPAVIGNFVDGQITRVRFGLSEPAGPSTVFVATLDPETNSPSETISEGKLASTTVGWNEVELETPVTINANTTYIIGFDYEQKSSLIAGQIGGQYEATNWPLVVDMTVNPNAETQYGFMAYGDFGQGVDWYNFGGSGNGNLCIQAIVKGGSFIDEDIKLSGFSSDKKYMKSGEEMNFSFNIMNNGNTTPSSYTLNVTVDGQIVKTLDTPAALTYSDQTLTASATLPADLYTGPHTVAVTVADINGNIPTQMTTDDRVSANVEVYTMSYPRQMNLVEQFTSTACVNCPLGTNVMNELGKLRDDLAFVAVHNNTPGESSLMTDESLTISNNLLIEKHNPSAAFNRYCVDDVTLNPNDWLDFTIGWDASMAPTYAMIYSEVINMSDELPSFATVNITSNYNKETRQLDITVSGDVSADDFNYFVGEDAAVTVYLTEDNIIAPQVGGTEDYVHNHVLRDVVSQNTLGDPVQFTADNKYSNTYTVTLDEGWNADNMNIVAFIGRPVTATSWVDDVWVNNTNMVKLSESSTAGITNAAVSDSNVTEVARYTIDGRKINRPEKGINIVKMSDGSSHKIMVK